MFIVVIARLNGVRYIYSARSPEISSLTNYSNYILFGFIGIIVAIAIASAYQIGGRAIVDITQNFLLS